MQSTYGGAGPEAASGTRTDAQGVVHEAAQVAKDRAHAAWDDAKETTRSKLNEQKDAAAQGIGEVAGALRDAARHRDDGDGLGRLGAAAADGLERVSGALRSKDVSTMLRDVESFARQQPVAFFGLALAAGFLAVRFMKSGERRDEEQESWT
jgi:hypothetical protein